MRSYRPVIALAALMLIVAACGSGPSPEALAANRIPTTTTTTEPPPEGIVVVRITNGAFRPSNLKMDLEKEWIVQFRNEDDPSREYVIEGREGEFQSPLLKAGDTWDLDMRDFPTGIYRYYAELGRNRFPGSIDTRPAQ